nr:ribonuclease H-like domain-containing protein [Tanacetum cinerariifolium]
MKDKVKNLNPQSTPQVFPSFEEKTSLVTYPDEVEEIIGIPIEVEPLDETPLKDLGLNTYNHGIPLSSREIPNFDEPEPQPQPLPSCPSLEALPLPDYVPGPEEPEHAPPSPVYIPYVPKLVYPEYIQPEDDVFPAEEQPLPAVASPTAESPGYIPESDPDEDPKEDNDEDPEEDPADYPADHDDEEEEVDPSGYDANEEDKEQDEDDDDEEEEHPASADSIPPPPALQDIGYGIRDTWIDPRDVAEEEALTTLKGVNTRDTQDIYRVMEDTQGRQTKIFQRVEALVDDSQYHYETSQLVDQEARCSREA